MNKKYLIASFILGAAIITGAISYANLASAQGDTDITQELAEKLDVSEDKITTAFDSIREERKAERQQTISDNLDRAVSDGVITSEQKQEILTKQDEFQNKQESLMKERQDWIDNNNIDESKLEDYNIGPGFGFAGHHGRGGGFMGMMR